MKVTTTPGDREFCSVERDLWCYGAQCAHLPYASRLPCIA